MKLAWGRGDPDAECVYGSGEEGGKREGGGQGQCRGCGGEDEDGDGA